MPGWWNGLHAALKMLWAKAHEGSTPSPGTKKTGRIKSYVLGFFIFKLAFKNFNIGCLCPKV